MIRVAIDTKPLVSGHSARGVGMYTENLIRALRQNKNLDLLLFTNQKPFQSADVIHYPYFDLFFRSPKIEAGVSTVVTIHDVIPLIFPKSFPKGLRGSLNFYLQKKSLSNVSQIITDSQASKKDIARILDYPQEKIQVIYLAASPQFKKMNSESELDMVKRKFNLPTKFILYVGDVNWNKNLPNLVKAVKIADCKIVMVGKALVDENLPETQSLNKLIKNLNLEKEIIKTGYVKDSDLAGLYNLASATILPSLYEGFGLPILESMTCGTPVISSNKSSLSEISGGLAIICDPEDPGDMAKAIKKALEMPKNTHDVMSKKLVMHANRFTWEKVAGETENVYKKAISRA